MNEPRHILTTLSCSASCGATAASRGSQGTKSTWTGAQGSYLQRRLAQQPTHVLQLVAAALRPPAAPLHAADSWQPEAPDLRALHHQTAFLRLAPARMQEVSLLHLLTLKVRLSLDVCQCGSCLLLGHRREVQRQVSRSPERGARTVHEGAQWATLGPSSAKKFLERESCSWNAPWVHSCQAC